ncbi:MAG: B12-binding domain-containing radical SAM protein [Phycisphaerae bacterium]
MRNIISTPRHKLRLINPRSPLSTITMPGVIQRMTFTRKALFMPLNLAVCAAVVPEGWDVEIVDENTHDEPHRPDATGIDAVGIGAMTSQATRAYELADAYRRLGVKVILGGIHPSALPQEAMQHADIVCRGDAEGTLPRALEDLAAGTPKPLYDWSEQPDAPIATPRKDLLNPADYLVFNPIQTTRGCPHGCTFCTTPAIFGRRYRQRPVEDIVQEIRTAKEAFGTSVFIFSDDNVAGSPRWAMRLFEALRELDIRWASQCDILIARRPELLKAMRDSGCIGLILGLESPRAGTLREAGKRFISADAYEQHIRTIQSHGISLWGSFIFGFDTDDWRDCMASVRFAQRTGLVMSCYIILTPYPGTAIFEQYRSEGRLLTEDWTQYNGSTVCFEPRRMTVEQLRHAQMAGFHEFFMPSSALRRLKLWPFKKHSWLANLAAYHGLRYYYNRNARTLPRFADFVAPDADRRIARSLGIR